MTSDSAKEAELILPVTGESRRTTDEEFSDFMARSSRLLTHTAWLLCGDRYRAEELAQQALVKTYVAWPRARATDPFSYARRVLVNTRIDSWRKHRRERLTAPHDLPETGASSQEEAHVDRDRLVRALSRLSEQRRRVVVLRYLIDLTERQVAEDLGISVGAVKSAAARGLAQMRELLDPPTTHAGKEPR